MNDVEKLLHIGRSAPLQSQKKPDKSETKKEKVYTDYKNLRSLNPEIERFFENEVKNKLDINGSNNYSSFIRMAIYEKAVSLGFGK